MGFFGSLWKGVKSVGTSAYRLGKKAVSTVSTLGRKAINVGRDVVNAVEKVPIIGDVATPFTAAARGALGAAETVVGAAERAKGYMDTGEKLVGQAQGVLQGARQVGRGVRGVLRTGDLQQAAQVARQASDVYGKGTQLVDAAQRKAKDIQRRELR